MGCSAKAHSPGERKRRSEQMVVDVSDKEIKEWVTKWEFKEKPKYANEVRDLRQRINEMDKQAKQHETQTKVQNKDIEELHGRVTKAEKWVEEVIKVFPDNKNIYEKIQGIELHLEENQLGLAEFEEQVTKGFNLTESVLNCTHEKFVQNEQGLQHLSSYAGNLYERMDKAIILEYVHVEPFGWPR